VFVVILRADGLEDFELPVSTIQMRIRDVRGSYVRVTVPNPTEYTQEILARASGRMIIFAGEQTADGQQHLEEIIYANIQNLYFNQGSTNILTLAGTRFITHSNPGEVTLDGVRHVSRDESGRVKVRASVDRFVRPIDLVTAEGETFTADLIIHTVLAADAYMDVEGAASG